MDMSGDIHISMMVYCARRGHVAVVNTAPNTIHYLPPGDLRGA